MYIEETIRLIDLILEPVVYILRGRTRNPPWTIYAAGRSTKVQQRVEMVHGRCHVFFGYASRFLVSEYSSMTPEVGGERARQVQERAAVDPFLEIPQWDQRPEAYYGMFFGTSLINSMVASRPPYQAQHFWLITGEARRLPDGAGHREKSAEGKQ